jgi:hypothetical protein
MKAAAKSCAIDREKLRARLRLQGPEYVYYMLADALEVLSDDQLASVVGRYIPLEQLRRDGPAAAIDVLADVKRFAQASLRRDYYEEFRVDSRNCTDLSRGTMVWISDFNRHLDRCIGEAETAKLEIVIEAFELLFDLVRRIDSGTVDILFFADEGGSWLFGIDWPKTVAAYASCLGRELAPGEFAAKTVAVIDEFARHDRVRLIEVASRAVPSSHRDALLSSAGQVHDDVRIRPRGGS